MSNLIPKVPQVQNLDGKDYEKLQSWIEYFNNLSKRVTVVTKEEDGSVIALERMLEVARDIAEKDLDFTHLGETLAYWPKTDQVAFVLNLDTSYPHTQELGGNHAPEEMRIFCFGDMAFKPDYFEWDGDGEEDPDCTTYSLRGYPKKVLSWSYITKLLIDQIKELEDRVPEPPQ